MLDVVRQRPDLRQLLRLMYPGAGLVSAGGGGRGSSRNAGGSQGANTEASSNGSSAASGPINSSTASTNGGGVSAAAAAAWRAVAGRPTQQQGQTEDAVTATPASLVEVTTLH